MIYRNHIQFSIANPYKISETNKFYLPAVATSKQHSKNIEQYSTLK